MSAEPHAPLLSGIGYKTPILLPYKSIIFSE
nr:MAG TPA: hypothetical protein [Caudoviricetes sp.]